MVKEVDKYASIFNNKVRRELNYHCEQLGLSESNYFYLKFLAETPGISQNYFIDSLHREQSVVTRQINRLVQDGWIDKKVSATDHRRSELYLTEKGQGVLKKLAAITALVDEHALAGLTSTEAETFAHLLKKAALSYSVEKYTDL